MSPSTRTIPEIHTDELAKILNDDGVSVLDVREDWEFRRGRVPGAISIPLAQLPGRIADLPRDKRYAIICEHGNRSLAATEFLLRNGFERVASVAGGTNAWARNSRPLERDQT
jgi:rhodanese-related sulfurtransferase